MTVTGHTGTIGPGEHVVHLYEHDHQLAEAVGSYLLEGIRVGAASVVIATQPHLRAFEEQLTASGIEVRAASRRGALVLLDAEETLARFMPQGEVDPQAFRQVIGGVLRRAAENGTEVRAYGEMVALLWEAGQVPAAIELEKLWNDLAGELEFSLLCAYRSESVVGSEHAGALDEVCHLHTSVYQPQGGEAAPAEASMRFPAELSAPRAARRFVAGVLGRWARAQSLCDDAVLVVSELSTNAVMHAATPFSVVVRDLDGGVRISVKDASAVEPVILRGRPLGLSGRGLQLVELLARRWGVEAASEGKAVWAELGR